MSRLAANRDSYLSPGEIAAETLRQFDEGPGEPSIRSLSAALGVAPAAIYHHYPSRAAIFQSAVELVWNGAAEDVLTQFPDPFEADAVDVLVGTGLATRRAWLAHHRLARYMAATPEAGDFTTRALGLMAGLFEGLGLEPEAAAARFHTYASFMIGAVLFAADRKTANEELERVPTYSVALGERPGKETRTSIDDVMDLSITNPARDEELFAEGLRRLIEAF